MKIKNIIKSTFKTGPGKVVLYGYFLPAIVLVVVGIWYFIAGCHGGFLAFKLSCSINIFPPILMVYIVLATIYLWITWIIFLPILLIAVGRVLRGIS